MLLRADERKNDAFRKTGVAPQTLKFANRFENKIMGPIRKVRRSVELDETTFQAFDAELERLEEAPSAEILPASEVVSSEGSRSDLKPPSVSDFSESLLAGCRQCRWVFDPVMTIFPMSGEHAHGAEEFRSLRSRLYRARKQQNLKSVLVTSAVAKEGRSFVALNLAQVLALQPGCRVLLIDGDLRTPRLHTAFGTSANPGLSEYLLQQAEEFAIMQRGSTGGLFLIPAGRSVSGQTELIASGRLHSLIEQVESFFDWIIVDSPPAIALTDAALLANSCDGVILVVRSHSTPFDVVQQARARFHDESLVGVVLNRIPTKAWAKS
jgi:protein-tyrosine kinase